MRGVSDRSARRLRDVVERDERRPHNVIAPASGSGQFIETYWVQITSTSLTDGRYPGTLYARIQDAATGSFELEQGEATGGIWVDTPNGETLSTGTYYPARITGVKPSDGKPIFDVLGTFGSVAATSGVYVSRVAGQTITNDGSWYAVEFDTETLDTDGFWAVSPNPTRVTIPASGYYLVTAHGGLSTAATGFCYTSLWTNGTGTLVGTSLDLSSTFRYFSLSTVARFASGGTYYELKFRNNGSGNVSTTGGVAITATKIGSA